MWKQVEPPVLMLNYWFVVYYAGFKRNPLRQVIEFLNPLNHTDYYLRTNKIGPVLASPVQD